jgi:peptide/nickel transport system substrate-binding protein
MHKEPIALYIFRLFTSLGLFVFMCMLYWSFTLIEKGNQRIQSDLESLHSEVSSLQSAITEGSRGVLFSTNKPASNLQRSYIDSALPNLLNEGEFYHTTLPRLLGTNFKPQGNFRSATIGKPDNLHPFANWASVIQWTSLCGVTVSKLQFGKYETMAPDMAIKMEERINPKSQHPEYWIHLRDNVYWEPLSKNLFSETINLAPHFLKKHQVTAHDFKFWFDAMMNPYNQETSAVAIRTYWLDVEAVEVLDDLTLVVRWKTHQVSVDGRTESRTKYIAKALTGELKPLASFVYKYFSDGKKIIEEDADPNTYRTSSVWAQNFSQHWAKNIIPSCGPWIFDGMTDQQISFRRNPNFYNPLAALTDTMLIEFKDSPDAIWQGFKAGRLDSYNIQPDQLLELDRFLKSPVYEDQAKQSQAIQQLHYLARQYSYVGWNAAKPFFSSKKVRQAMTMAIDRKRILREYLNGRAEEITGTFFRNSPSYDPSIVPFPYDIQKARQYLEEEGWYDSDGSGVISKLIDGKRTPFQFTLTYFVKAPIGKVICEYIATALRDLGIVCSLNGVDIADLSAVYDDKSFDAILMAWALGTPPEDPTQLWSSAGAKEKGSSNAVGFANAKADAIIEKLQYEYDLKTRIALYHQFDKILYEEQPYTFLYSPKVTFLYREYLQNVFIPSDRQDLVPGANISEPDSSIFWIKTSSTSAGNKDG